MAIAAVDWLVQTFNNQITGSLAISVILLLFLFAFILVFSGLEPMMIIIMLLPLVWTLVTFGIGLPSWVLIMGYVLLGAGIGLYVYARIS